MLVKLCPSPQLCINANIKNPTPGANVIQLRISVLHIFSLYFGILFNGDLRIRFPFQENMEKMSVKRKYGVL